MISTLLIISVQIVLFAALIIFLTKTRSLPFLHLFIPFICGILFAVPPYYIEYGVAELGWDSVETFPSLILNAFVFVGLNEEVFKFLPLVLLFLLTKWWKSGLEVVAISLMISLGFAGFENVLYAFNFDSDIVLFRGLTAIPVHLTFSIVMGYYLYYSKKKRIYFVISLLSAALIHGIYDFFIIQPYRDWLTIFSLVTLAFSLFLSWIMIRSLRRIL